MGENGTVGTQLSWYSEQDSEPAAAAAVRLGVASSLENKRYNGKECDDTARSAVAMPQGQFDMLLPRPFLAAFALFPSKMTSKTHASLSSLNYRQSKAECKGVEGGGE